MPIDDLIVAEIEQSFFEYHAKFKEPITIFWSGGRQAEIINAMQKALAPWRVDLENIAWQQHANNLRELQITFAVPSQVASVQVGLAGVTMTAFNPDWSRAPELLKLFGASVSALSSSTGQPFQFQQTTLGFHVRPPSAKPFREVITQFVNARALGSEDAAMFGLSTYYNDHSFVIDASGPVPGGLFVKLTRHFAVGTSFEAMAKMLYSDEEAVLKRLGLKLQ
jgi:hypothetical protein